MCCAMPLFGHICRDFRGRRRILTGWNLAKARLPSRRQWGTVHERSDFMTRITVVISMIALIAGCGGPDKKNDDFFTSGNRDADQRAEQRVAKTEQLRGEGGGAQSGKEPQKKKS